MKKIFAFMMGLIASISIGHATEITLPGTTLDLLAPTMIQEAGWYGSVAYFMNKDVLVITGYESYKSVNTQTWISALGAGSQGSSWAQQKPFRGSAYYTNQSYTKMQEGTYLAYLVTNCDSVMAYGYNNAASKYLAMNIFEMSGDIPAIIDDAAILPTFAINNSAVGGEKAGIMKQALDASKIYLVVVYAVGNSNSRLYEMAFFRHQSGDGIEEILAEGKAVKVLRNGKVVILRGDKAFDITGQRVP